MRDALFIIRAPFEDAGLGGTWFCRDCAMMEGALLANPQWTRAIDVRRLPFPRPRQDIISLIGEGNQGMPVLVLGDIATAPGEAHVFEGRAFINDPKAILSYLATTHGGAGPHP